MRRRVAAELALLKAQKDRLGDQARVLDQQIGTLAGQAIRDDEYTTKSSIGRLLGVSHTHVGNLIAAAADRPLSAQAGIAELDNVLAGDYVRERGARIVRTVSGFDKGDVLFQAGLDPRLFVSEDDTAEPQIPHMLWQLDSGEWLGVGEATVGYGGTGCGYSVDALVHAGVDRDTAEEIVRWRFCDASDLADPDSWQVSTAWPVQARAVPRVVKDRVVVNFGEGMARVSGRSFHTLPLPSWTHDADGVDRSGFYPSAVPRTNFEAWLDFLDAPGEASWAAGRRTARVFLDEAVALAQGFVVFKSPGKAWSPRSIPQIVIEQGHVQLWGHFYQPLNRTQLLPDEAYEALGQAKVYPDELAERDARNTRPLLRLLHSLRAHDRNPHWIDVSDDGAAQLTFTPVPTSSREAAGADIT